MSVWPECCQLTPRSRGREGALVSDFHSRGAAHLESMLEALAQVSFPINPQIYHDAAIVYRLRRRPRGGGGDHPGGVSCLRRPAR